MSHKISGPAALFPCIFAVAAALFVAGSAPVIYWGDDGDLVSGALGLGLGHPPGHPVYVHALGWIRWLPAGDAAHRFNLLSGLLLAAAAGLTAPYFLRRREPGGVTGCLAAASIILAHPFVWHQSGRSETYALHGLLLMILILVLTGKPGARVLIAGPFLFALLAGNQLLLAALAFPGLALLWFSRVAHTGAGRQPVPALLALILGLSVYLYVPLRSIRNPPVLYNTAHTAAGFLHYATARDYQKQFYGSGDPTPDYPSHLRETFRGLASGIQVPVLLLAAAGVVIGLARRPAETTGLLMIFAGTTAGSAACRTFTARNWDFQGYLVPAVLCTALLAGIFIKEAVRAAAGRKTASAALAVIAVLPLADLPRRLDDSVLSTAVHARMFGLTFTENAPPGAVLIMRSDLLYILTYMRSVERYRDDIRILSLNRVLRLRNDELLSGLHPGVVFPDPEFMEDAVWMRQIIRANRADRAVMVELADAGRYLPETSGVMVGPVEVFAQEPMPPGPARNLWYFRHRVWNDPAFLDDYNAVEQVCTIFYNRGTFSLHRNRERQALDDLGFAARLDPQRPEIFNNLGVVLARLNDRDGAVRCFNHVLNLQPGHRGAGRNLELMRGMIRP